MTVAIYLKINFKAITIALMILNPILRLIKTIRHSIGWQKTAINDCTHVFIFKSHLSQYYYYRFILN